MRFRIKRVQRLTSYGWNHEHGRDGPDIDKPRPKRTPSGASGNVPSAPGERGTGRVDAVGGGVNRDLLELRSAVPAAVAEVKALEAEVERLRRAERRRECEAATHVKGRFTSGA